jgi:hypothetical protein
MLSACPVSVAICVSRRSRAGDSVVRSDEELALSVLRYGKILSRKLENRMQASGLLQHIKRESHHVD